MTRCRRSNARQLQGERRTKLNAACRLQLDSRSLPSAPPMLQPVAEARAKPFRLHRNQNRKSRRRKPAASSAEGQGLGAAAASARSRISPPPKPSEAPPPKPAAIAAKSVKSATPLSPEQAAADPVTGKPLQPAVAETKPELLEFDAMVAAECVAVWAAARSRATANARVIHARDDEGMAAPPDPARAYARRTHRIQHANALARRPTPRAVGQ